VKPRTLLGTASLGAAAFLATLWLLGVGGKPSSAAAPPADAVVTDGHPGAPRTGAVPDASVARAIAAEATLEASQYPEIARDAVTATDPEIRVRALQLLGEAPAQEGLDTLLAASVGNDARDRAAAVSALRRQLQHGNRDPRIWNALQGAAADSDPIVVVMAQSALEGFEQLP
jgi:hypothetical protein